MQPLNSPTALARAVRFALLLGSASLSAAVLAQSANAEQSQHYRIAAGPLSVALSSFASSAGITLPLDPAMLEGKRSAGLNGDYSVAQGFQQLLQGSGLQAVPLANGNYGLRKNATADGPLELDSTSINATGEQSITGAIDGVVATRTSVGTKTNTPINEVPQSISVITREEMDKRGVQDFNSAVAYTPGVRAIDYVGGQGAPDIYMRGFRSFNLFGIYKDGLRSGFNQYDTDFDTYGLERIDVIRGPASVLYGQMAPGGMINLTSKRATETPYHEVQLQAGSYDRKQGSIDLGGPVDDDGQLFYRLTAVKRDSGTQVDHSPDNLTYIAPALTWKPDDDTSLTLLTSYLKTRRGGSEQSFPVAGTLNGLPSGHVPSSTYLGNPNIGKYEVENTSIGYSFERQLNADWSFTQNSRYMKAKVDYVNDWSNELDADGRTFTFGFQDRPKDTDTFMLDNNLKGLFSTGALEHELLVGIDYAHYKGYETRRDTVDLQSVDIFDPVYNSVANWDSALSVDSKSVVAQKGLYLQDQLRFDNWRLTVGGRKDWVDGREYSYIGDGERVQQSGNKFTGRVGLAYLFDNGITPYASYSTSFQPVPGIAYDGSALKPTEGKQYEVGVKYQAPGQDSFISVAAFDLTQKNVVTSYELDPSLNDQTGAVRSRGIEVEGKASLSQGLDLIASYAYTDAEVTQDSPNAAGVSREGNTPISVAKHTGALWLDYTVQGGSLAGLGMGVGQRYVGSSYNAQNTLKVPGYSLTDASIRYDLGQLSHSLKGTSVDVSAHNLFDKTYFTPGFYEDSVFYGTRRNVIGSVTYSW